MHIEGYGPQDIEMVEKDCEHELPVCVCADHVDTDQVVFCEACGDWTDTIQLYPELPYSEERAQRTTELVADFNRLMAETESALAKGRAK